jgi:hypothetical protein
MSFSRIEFCSCCCTVEGLKEFCFGERLEAFLGLVGKQGMVRGRVVDLEMVCECCVWVCGSVLFRSVDVFTNWAGFCFWDEERGLF